MNYNPSNRAFDCDPTLTDNQILEFYGFRKERICVRCARNPLLLKSAVVLHDDKEEIWI